MRSLFFHPFENALVLVRLDHVASSIVNANRSGMRPHLTRFSGLEERLSSGRNSRTVKIDAKQKGEFNATKT